MLCLDDHRNAERAEGFLERITNLCGEPLLHLQSSCAYIHHSGNFRQSGDVAVGNVRHVGFAVKRNHVVFAQAVHLHVLHDHHLLHALGEDCTSNDLDWIVPLALGEKLHRLCNSLGSFEQTFS